MQNVQSVIEKAWDNRAEITSDTGGEVREAVARVLAGLDNGELRVAEKIAGAWQVHPWVKQAVLLSFRLNENELMGIGQWDKVPLKTGGWSEIQFESAGFRAVPGSIIRHGAFIDQNVVLMPSFVNIGAHVGEGTMVDTWVTIGSCAQVGKHCHISGGVGIGGVLEPLQANPVIIEDNCFIGARSEVAEGVIIEEGSVISMGVFLGASTKIVDRATGAITYGRVPAYSVVVPGTLPGKSPSEPSLACAVIVKRVDEKTRSKTSINELLRA
jgi:2,3,4,5-tetrahydropyridine-2-carboxylate N-succinyltransferase